MKSTLRTFVLFLLAFPAARTASARECAIPAHSQPAASLVVVLQFALPPQVAPWVAEAAVSEADAIWSRYGIAVTLADAAGCPDVTDAVHLAVVAGTQHARRTYAPLGAIRFFDDGTPERVITVFYDDLIASVAGRSIVSRREPEYPAGRGDQIAGRVLGRVLAHELGHFLLRWPAHAASGLMRATQWTPELCGGSTSDFLLSGNEAARLASVLGRSHPVR